MSCRTRRSFKRCRSSGSPINSQFRNALLTHLLHTVGSFSLLIGFGSQIVVLYGAVKAGEKPAIVQAVLLLLALGSASLALSLRPHSPPQLIPDLLGCFAALLLFAPAVEAVRKLWAKSKDAEKSK